MILHNSSSLLHKNILFYIPSAANPSTFLIDCKYLYIAFSYIIS